MCTTTVLTDVFNNRSIYWEGTGAAELFGFVHGDDVFSGLQDRILILKEAVNTCNGYRNVVGGGGEDLSHQNIFDLRTKSMYLITAYELALKRMGYADSAQWVKDVCGEAITVLQSVGIHTIKTARTISNWNIMFRK